MTSGLTGAGWFPDPTEPGWVRYWDGTRWTGDRSRAPLYQPSDRYDRPDGQPYVGFRQAVLLALRQYVRFSGRASRSEYWWWTLFGVLATSTVQWAVTATAERSCRAAGCTPGDGLFLVVVAVAVVLVVPSVAVTVRRLHDIGRSGWWYLVGFVPVAGAVVLFVWLVTPGDPTINDYGNPPRKGSTTARHSRLTREPETPDAIR